jgi:transglutaminase-like putative cysteine protease
VAGLNPPIERSARRDAARRAIALPRVLMSWEDWLTFAAVLITFVSVAVSIEQANWVDNMPRIVPTAMAGLLVGLVAARVRLHGLAIQPFVLAVGLVVVVAAVQNFAEGATVQDRVRDTFSRMHEWYVVVRSGDISNDNLPFVALVHSAAFLAAYFASWSIYRWHNPWLALVPGGFILLTNISFLEGKPSGAFVVFLFGALFIVARAYLQKKQAQWQAEGVEYPDTMSLNALHITFWVALALMIAAWQIPLGARAATPDRIFDRVVGPFKPLSDDFVRLFHNLDARRPGNLHSFGATLPIQGEIRLGSKVLFEVQSGEPGLVRGTSYDVYTGAGWRATDRESEELPAGSQVEEEYQQRATTILRITLSDNERTIFSLGTPLGTNLPTYAESPRGPVQDIERMRSTRSLASGDTYNAVGSRSIATVEQLREAGTAYPGWVEDRYLQLPIDLPRRVREEARRVAAGAANPYDQAKAIETYLRTFPYDLSVPAAPPGRDVVDYHLFELRRGYFDYQSTSMAVMLRALGVPARVAVGYALDPAESQETTYTVRKRDAYSWVEVYFPGYGWVNFNPTSDRPAGGAEAFGSGGSGGLANVDDPTAGLEGIFPDVDFFPELEEVDQALAEPPGVSQSRPWYLLWVALGVLAGAAALGLAGRFAWNFGLGGLEGPARLWAKTQRLASWAGLGQRPHDTPREWSRRLGGAIGREDAATRLAEAYQESRYGRPDLARSDPQETESAYRRVRGALVARVLRWKGSAKK